MNHKFVEFIPEQIDENTIYVSIEYSTGVHKCCCGCGNEVVTPFSPTDWKLIFDGDSITLSPSIGNWNFDCRSHYFIRNNKVRWAGSWTDEEIEQGRNGDRESKEAYYYNRNQSTDFYLNRKPRKRRWNLWKRLFGG